MYRMQIHSTSYLVIVDQKGKHKMYMFAFQLNLHQLLSLVTGSRYRRSLVKVVGEYSFCYTIQDFYKKLYQVHKSITRYTNNYLMKKSQLFR